MKRVIAWVLSVVLLLTGCGISEHRVDSQSEGSWSPEVPVETEFRRDAAWAEGEIPYSSLEDEQLLAYVEDLVYQEAVIALDSDSYLVENVSAVYISKEYLDEVSFNSQANIYFGYTLAELDELFQGNKYIFTLGENGKTVVQELQQIEDVTSESILKDIAIGTGVILVGVTVSTVTAGTAPAVSMIFAVSAETAKIFAASTAALGGISSGIVRGIETGDFQEAMEAAALGAANGFKWGAIGGAIAGGGIKGFALKSATKSGLTMNEAALIQADSQFPVDVIAQMHSMDEYSVYKEAGLKSAMVNGRTALIQKIDLDYVSIAPDGTEVTNLQRMCKGLKPIDPVSKKAYELHHVGQQNDGILAVLKMEQHRGEGNFTKLHPLLKDTNVDHGAAWGRTVKEFWKALGNAYANGGV